VGRLDGKVAIVTGAGSGIGEATARLLGREGASVVVADLNRAEAERVANDLDAAIALEVDVSEEESVVRMIKVGSGEGNAKALEKMIKELLAEKD